MAGEDGVAAAIPADLIHWAGWATGLYSTLQSKGDLLDIAITALARSAPDPSILSIGPGDYVGAQVMQFATRNQGTDQWVGQVGWGFFRAGTKGLPPGVVHGDERSFLDSIVTTTDRQLGSIVGGDPALKIAPIPTDLGQ